MEQTFDLMDAMERANPRTQHYGIFLYTPFPSPLLDSLPAEFTPAAVARGVGDIEVFHFLPPWHTPAYVRQAAGDLGGHPLRLLSALAHGRARPGVQGRLRRRERGRALPLAHRHFDHPVELQLANEAAKRLRGFL